MQTCYFLLLVSFSLLRVETNAFSPQPPAFALSASSSAQQRRVTARPASTTTTTTTTAPNTSLKSSSTSTTTNSKALQARRKELLTRASPHFCLDRLSGRIEFGATATLVTELDNTATLEQTAAWLQDIDGLAYSIWEERLVKGMGNSVYELSLMTLQFITFTMAPKVQVEMKTQRQKANPDLPVFNLQSIRFDPNIQVLPGLSISTDSLGMAIEVTGQMRPNVRANNKGGVIGALAFSISGTLPPPMRVLPESVLQTATETINETVTQFAITNFQKGASRQFKEFVKKRTVEEEEAAAVE